jgi:hypothetical protein
MVAIARRESRPSGLLAGSRKRPRLARDDDNARPVPVREHHARIEAAFGAPADGAYSPAAKVALFIGAPIALWAGIVIGGAQLLRALH